jgi:protein-tyrosine phosphatase
MSAPAAAADARWLRGAFARGVLWLLLLGPLFFLSYGFANQYAGRLDATLGVGGVVFDWERRIPFWPWTIIPYWSIDLFYGLAFLCCRDRTASTRLALRLLSVQVICVSCFLLWPLRFQFERPAVEGIFGALFNVLTSFDRPYNQAPSLHIALLVIIWRQFAAFTASPGARGVIHAWALLIGVSVLTTWQHHFIDVPTGAAVGLFCLWLWPSEGRTPLRPAAVRRPAIALRYLLGAVAFFAVGLALGGIGLLLCWPALSLALVALNYAWAGAAGFQKQDGRRSLAARWLFAPYALAGWVNSRLWTRRSPAPSLVSDGIWVGRLPTSGEFAEWAALRGGPVALFDLTAELPAPRLPAGVVYRGMPCLDLVTIPASSPSGGSLERAVEYLSELKRDYPDREIWVACALGASRSVSVTAAWLCRPGQGIDDPAAIETLRRARPSIVITPNAAANIRAFCKEPVSS